jgi:hypothetical protein
MHKNFNYLCAAKKKLIRALHEAQKEYSRLHHAVDLAEQSRERLERHREIFQDRLMEYSHLLTLTLSAHQPSKATGPGPVAGATMKAPACGTPENPPTSTPLTGMYRSPSQRSAQSWRLPDDTPTKPHQCARKEESLALGTGVVLRAHAERIFSTMAQARETMEELTFKTRHVVHVAALVDRAADIELQCIACSEFASAAPGRSDNRSASQTADRLGNVEILVNASPIFPETTVADAPKVLQDCERVIMKASDLSLKLRRLVSHSEGAMKQHSGALHKLIQNKARTAATKLAQCCLQRRAAGAELTTIGVKIRTYQWEKAALVHRLRQLDAAIALRKIAGRDLASHDPALHAASENVLTLSLMKEKQYAQRRIDELDDAIGREERERKEIAEVERELEREMRRTFSPVEEGRGESPNEEDVPANAATVAPGT